MKHSNNIRLALAALMGAAAIGFASCEDQPDEYKSTSGSPEVQYVRLPESADSVITKSYLHTTVGLVGNNLRSIRKLLFNDQEALLNTSYITDNTLLVDIPKNIPAAVTDKIYMINEAGDTTTYDFYVIVPPPVVSAMSCEYAAAGDEVTLTGDYFIQDPYKPLKVKFNDGTLPVTDIRSISKNSITFTVPAGAQSGRVCVESVYARAGRSSSTRTTATSSSTSTDRTADWPADTAGGRAASAPAASTEATSISAARRCWARWGPPGTRTTSP